MENKNTEKQIIYKPNQNGYLSQELKKVLLKVRKEATEKEISLIEELGFIIQMSSYGVSSFDIDNINRTLLNYQKESKEKKIKKLEEELSKLKEGA